MAIVNVADVLMRARQFEDMLADYYRNVADHSTREGVRLLTDFMSRHRQRLDQELDKLDPAQVRRICSMPIRYEPQAADCRCLEGVQLPANASASDVLDVAVNLDECLVRLYRQASRQCQDDPEALALFESLIRLEERDEIELKKIKAMDYF